MIQNPVKVLGDVNKIIKVLGTSKIDQNADIFDDIWTYLYALANTIADGVVSWFRDNILSIINSIKDTIGNIWNTVSNLVTETYNAIVGWLNIAIQNVSTLITNLETTLSGLINNAVSTVTGAISNLKDDVTTTVNGVVSSVTGAVNGAVTTINNTVNGVVSSVVSTVNSVKDTITEGINNAITAVNDFTTSVKDKIIDGVGKAIDNIKTEFGNFIDRVVGGLIAGFNELKNGIGDLIDRIGKWLYDQFKIVTDALNGVIADIKLFIDNAVKWVVKTYDDVSKWLYDQFMAITTTLNNAIGQARTDIVNWVSKAGDTINKVLHDIIAEISSRFYAWATGPGAQFIGKIGNTISDWNKVSDPLRGDLINLASGNPVPLTKLIDDFGAVLGIKGASRDLIAFLRIFWDLAFIMKCQYIGAEMSVQAQANASLGLQPIPENIITDAFHKGVINYDRAISELRWSGINAERSKTILDSSFTPGSPGAVQSGYLRGIITEHDHDNYLRAYGFDGQTIELYKQIYRIIPGVADIISMAVKEAFTPEIAEKFGQYQDLPREFVEWAGKQGLTEDWCRRYWAAHWDLPSPSMGFDMFHRAIIDKDTLTLLLRALDIMPFWREKLIELSYNPITRVDVRRLYRLNVIDREKVLKSYLDIGYSPENAELLTQYTERYEKAGGEDEDQIIRNMAKTVYRSAFINGVITRDELSQFYDSIGYVTEDRETLLNLLDFERYARNMPYDEQKVNSKYIDLLLHSYDRGIISADECKETLFQHGYTDSQAATEIGLLDYARSLRIRDMILDGIRSLYIDGGLTDGELYDYLSQYDFSRQEVTRFIDELVTAKRLVKKRPSLSDFVKFWKTGLIDDLTLADEIRKNGYSERDTALYLAYYAGSGS